MLLAPSPPFFLLISLEPRPAGGVGLFPTVCVGLVDSARQRPRMAADTTPPPPLRPAPVRLPKAPTASHRQTSSWRAPPPQGMEMSDAQEFGDQAQLLLPFPRKLPQGLQQKQHPQENLFSTLPQFITSATDKDDKERLFPSCKRLSRVTRKKIAKDFLLKVHTPRLIPHVI